MLGSMPELPGASTLSRASSLLNHIWAPILPEGTSQFQHVHTEGDLLCQRNAHLLHVEAVIMNLVAFL